MSLYRRKDSPFWWVKVGRKTRISTGTPDKAQAKEFESRLRERLWRRNKLGDRGSTSWAEVVQRYLKDSQRPRRRDRELLAWIEEECAIKEEPVREVADTEALQELRDRGLREGWAHSTVDRMMRTVRAVLRYAHREKLLDEVPHVPMFGEADEVDRFLTQDEFSALCAELPAHLRLAAQFAVCTLLRKDSQAQLTWDRVDLEAGTCWIRKPQMKGKRSAHGVTLSPEALGILREVKALNLPGARVFGQAELYTAAFKKACKRAGIEGTRWHDLRHTGASWAVQSGVTLVELMALGGWKSYASVLRYAHLAPGNTAAAAKVVGTKVAQSISARSQGKLPK
jgi:integrase